MNILTKENIHCELIKCNPSKIAVAYVGIDWKEFLPEDNKLTTIIVSPTIGSNPCAIQKIAREIGWENIYFLDELHAKIYIGDNSAIIGSANLTKNGLSGEDLFELCVTVQNQGSLKKLNNTFDTLLREAKQQYPTIESKTQRLKKLEQLWGASIANKVIKPISESNQFSPAFELLGKDHFYILWYQPGDFQYSDEVNNLDDLIEEIIMFTEEDEVEINKWALIWQITNESLPHKRTKLQWVYIHEIYRQGVIEDDCLYTTCAIQRTDKPVPPPPFELDKQVTEAFKKAIQDKEIKKYLIQDIEEPFNLAESLKGIEPLIKQMKTLYTT